MCYHSDVIICDDRWCNRWVWSTRGRFGKFVATPNGVVTDQWNGWCRDNWFGNGYAPSGAHPGNFAGLSNRFARTGSRPTGMMHTGQANTGVDELLSHLIVECQFRDALLSHSACDNRTIICR